MVSGPLLVVDAPWLLYRAYFSVPSSVTGADGHPVNALLGTANALLSVAEQVQPRAVAVCFGAEDATYRKQLLPQYHGQRDLMPSDLRRQFERAPELFAAFGWTVADGGELEADDVLGALARLEADAGGRTLILTADRDLYQAVDGATSVLHLKGQDLTEVDPAGVLERYGVQPRQVPDFIALRGDPSDNIPGAPGIGAKTAASLLARFGDLDALLTQAAGTGQTDLRPKLAEGLCVHAEAIRTYREVATLQPVEVERPPNATLDPAAAADQAERLGMARLAARLRGAATARSTG